MTARHCTDQLRLASSVHAEVPDAALCVQMIAERERVFHMNNDIIRSFKLPRGAYVRTVFKLLPPEVSLLLIFVVLAVLSVWGSNRFMQWAASTKYFGQHMNPEERAQLQNL